MPEKLKVPARLARAGSIDVSSPKEGQEDDRRVTLSFSSEEPFLRFFGYEILGHGDGEVDLTQLASGRAALLTDHIETIDAQVGVIERAWIEGGKGRAVVRFGKSARATEILARVRDNEITGVSVGYSLTRLVQVGERDGEPMIRASWRPYEITLCPVPADPTVGIGRSAGGNTDNTLTLERNLEGSDMPGANTNTVNTPQNNDANTGGTITPATVATEGKKARETENERVRAIVSLGRKFKMKDEVVDAALNGDTTVGQFQRSILDGMGSDNAENTRSRNAEIGMSEKDVKQYSLMRAVRYLSDPTDKRAREAAAFEIEASEAAQEHLRRDAKGLLVPSDVLTHQSFGRAQTVGTAAAGGALVDTEYLDGSFIGLLRKRTALTRLGVRTLTGLSGNVAIPRQTGGGTAYWVGEGQGPTDTELSFNTLNMTPHTLAAAVPITRRAIIQTSPDIEALVRDDLIRTLGLEIDRVGINGDADPDAPNGLLNSPINTTDFAADGAPIWSEIVRMESEIGADDADVEAMRYLFNALMRGHLKSTPKAPGTAEFMMRGREVNGYESVVSNNAPASSALLGNWSDFVIGMWSGLDLTVDNSTLASSGGSMIRAFQDLDFGVRHTESFCHGRYV